MLYYTGYIPVHPWIVDSSIRTIVYVPDVGPPTIVGPVVDRTKGYEKLKI